MTSRQFRKIALLSALFLFVLPSQAITTVPVDVVCPVCGTKNKFYAYASWGSYVYRYPSKFQLVFWPHTWSATLYLCSHCHLALFMWDFNEFPKEKKREVQEALKSVSVQHTVTEYTKVPMSEKLAIAEKVYGVLGKDDAFWTQFYRVQGYHLAQEKRPTEATAARTKSLEITQKMLADAKNEEKKKELLLASAAMRHFLKDDSNALSDLKAATQLRFAPKGMDQKQAEGYDGYLTELIKEYADKIKSGTVPDDLKAED